MENKEVKMEWPSLVHTRVVSGLTNECANNFQFLSLPSYAQLSFLLQQKFYHVVNNHCHQLIHHQEDAVTIAMTIASISLVQHTSIGTLLVTVTLACRETPFTCGC